MAKKSKPIRREFVLMNKNTPFQYQEAYKSLRTNLNFMAMGKACKKLMEFKDISWDDYYTLENVQEE